MRTRPFLSSDRIRNFENHPTRSSVTHPHHPTASDSLKKDNNLLSSILKKRIKREKDDEAAKIKQAKAKKRSSSERESLASVRQHMDAFEQQVNAVISKDSMEAQDGFLESVEVIKAVSGLPAPTLRLDGHIDEQIRGALGCMSASLGFTDEQRYVMVFNQFVQSGSMEVLVRRAGKCPASLLNTLVHVIGHSPDIMVAYSARKAVGNLFKLLYVGKKKPANRPRAHVRVQDPHKNLPSFKLFCDELRANGCGTSFGLGESGKGGKGGKGGKSESGLEVDLTADSQERDDLDVGPGISLASQGVTTEAYRVHFISLLLEAIVDYCGFVDEAGISLLPKETVEATNLFDVILCLRYDPNAYRIQERLDAALLALMGALDKATWEGRLPAIAFSLATSFSIKTAKALRAKVIRELPCGYRILDKRMSSVRRRCADLQQCSAFLLLDTILEPVNSSKRPDLKIVTKPPLDVEARISREQWFRSPETLTDMPDDATGAHVMNHFTRVELLLRLADMILWPSLLTAMNTSDADIKYLTPAFLRRWSSFLGQIQRRIRTLNPEEQAVKTMANFLKMSYDFYAEQLDG